MIYWGDPSLPWDNPAALGYRQEGIEYYGDAAPWMKIIDDQRPYGGAATYDTYDYNEARQLALQNQAPAAVAAQQAAQEAYRTGPGFIQWTAPEVAAFRADPFKNPHPGMGIFDDPTAGAIYSGQLYTPHHDKAFDNSIEGLIAYVGAAALAYGFGATAGAGLAAAGATGAEVGGAAAVDASTGLYAGESAYAGTATYGTVGGGATGFVGEVAIAPAGMELGGAVMPAADASGIATTTTAAGSGAEAGASPFLDGIKGLGQKLAASLGASALAAALQKKTAAPALGLRAPSQSPVLTPGDIAPAAAADGGAAPVFISVGLGLLAAYLILKRMS